MILKVKISIEVTDTMGAPITRIGDHPSSLTWDHEKSGGDNPRFYGDEVQAALIHALGKAVRSADMYVELRESSTSEFRKMLELLEAPSISKAE